MAWILFLAGYGKFFYERFDYIIVHLYNLILTSSVYPQDWKIAPVVPKPGELRPISLLPLPGKAFEHHIHNNIQAYLDREHLLTKSQNGFLCIHSYNFTECYMIFLTIFLLSMYTMFALNVCSCNVNFFLKNCLL